MSNSFDLDIQEIFAELSEDPWCKVNLEKAILKATNKALTTENQKLKEKLEELEDATKPTPDI